MALHVPGFPVTEQYVMVAVSVDSQVCPATQFTGRLAKKPDLALAIVQVLVFEHTYNC